MHYNASMPRKRTPSTDAARVVGYVRVSTDEQALGPSAQREALERWCAANGAELVAVYEDVGVSGGAPLDKRPGLLSALSALAEHSAGVLLVAKRDRLARDVMAAGMLERLAERVGARIRSAAGEGTETDDPSARLLRGIVDLFAEYERAIIRARTRAALAVKRQRGERIGEVPYGSRLAADGVRLEAEPAEQRVLELVRCLRVAGVSVAAIAERLNLDGVPARGTRWHPTTVARMVRAERAA
jgi:DNA invertase Pin-like site-specific DNA recombinase